MLSTVLKTKVALLREARRDSLSEHNSFSKSLDLAAVKSLSGREGVYLIATLGMNAVKVGWTNRLPQRLGAIQNGNPFPCFVAAFFETEEAGRLESLIHRVARDGVLNGEWFSGNAVELALADIEVKGRIMSAETQAFYGDSEPFEVDPEDLEAEERESPRAKDAWMAVPPKAKGRPKKYKGRAEHGAPLLQTRVDPELWEWAHAQPEGLRPLLERLIRAEMIAERKKAPPE